MKLHHSFTFVLLIASVACFAQNDTTKIVAPDEHESIKGKFFVGGGIGLSIISLQLYGFSIANNGPGYSAHITSASPVYNCTVDYGIMKDITVGACIAY